MTVQVMVHVSTPNGNHPAGIETFSRVPSVGEKIQVPEGIHQVIDVIHFSFRGLPTNAPVATILVQQ
ncbi:hypothetical protein ACE1CI_03490 [Aerosakkonemataceae cyanobacterium BLCC-F50]|uniref:Uncharacterized protein n=1 Tax=Floridaenema flaviceps BLCC-F50 TaxID=3153642 RepID=A0ABV4XJV8_9CYAN